MNGKNSHSHAEIIDQVVELINKNFSNHTAELIAEFTRQYYAFTPLEDLLSRSPRDLYGAVISHWNLMKTRSPGECKVHIYNPQFEQHGWQSTHTIIEVVHDDMPFLVDTLHMEVNRLGLSAHLLIHMGGMQVQRDKDGLIKEILPLHADCGNCLREAPILIEVDRQTDASILRNIEENLRRVLSDVRAAVHDWQAMRNRLKEAIVELDTLSAHHDKSLIEESKDFLIWMAENNFTFLGYREYNLVKKNGESDLVPVAGTGLGVLQDHGKAPVVRSFSSLPLEAQKAALSSDVLIISKTNTRSTVHRPAYTDYIGVKRFDAKGNLVGERRFIGLYTSVAYNSNPKQIPFLRHKVVTILERSNLAPGSHSAKDLLNILETLPRDDLFQSSPDELLTLSMGILNIQERRQIRLFVRKDLYGRFMSCLVYVPREHFNTELRFAIENILSKAFHSIETSFTTYFSESVLARIHFVMRLDPNHPVHYDVKELEAKLVAIARPWEEELRLNLVEQHGEEKGLQLFNYYAHSFSASYRESFLPRTAVCDLEHIHALVDEHSLGMSFYHSLEETNKRLHFKLYHQKTTVPLSDVLPMLENMGLRVIGEQPYRLRINHDFFIWINDFNMVRQDNSDLNIDDVKENFQEAFARIWRGDADNDRFNRLVLDAKLTWREVVIIRAYAKYLRQAGITFSQEYIETTFNNNATIVRLLIDFFSLRFNPALQPQSTEALQKAQQKILDALDGVVNLDEDRILRRFLDLMNATLRTNFFQKNKDGQFKTYVSFKLDSTKVPELPLPLPMFEIFVYSPRFEGVHLRGAKVSRGGLRWSDRREDFRTEVLGLMKAQAVKNAVIVPAGAKGGFVPKFLPTDGNREKIMEEGIACYRQFISGLLDVTDNIINDQIVPPTDVVRYDEDDPYLVVAADKGTATFSDIANAVSKDYNFWLQDAFASGGSAGYDHKKMGITARGGWESVKRHFLEWNIDIQTTDFTAVGIGDMAGDVFGNGMLLSRHTRLVAAFNHMHIFLDPKPVAETTFQERQRLFNLPRSSWEDYDVSLISSGGGIYKRSLKAIKITPEVKALLDITADTLTPTELIRAILKARVDLLWNGGIGTYVKAESELNLNVGDRANDSLRINGNELRCRVVGEGGNLGFTQLGRVEYALNGGVINTDFIDNSAGVDCSDHEVNTKILLNRIMDSGDLTEKQRNSLLEKMQDDVASMVLRHNYYQTLAVSLSLNQSKENMLLYRRYMQILERNGDINRELEALPTDKEIVQRQALKQGFTRPEIAVLLAYSKIIIKREILASDLPEDPYVAQCVRYTLPSELYKLYPKQVMAHSLRRELIATKLSNDIVNEMGVAFVQRLLDETGSTVAMIARAYLIAKNIFEMESFYKAIESLDKKVEVSVQLEMMLRMTRLVRRSTRWLLRHTDFCETVESTITSFTPEVRTIYSAFPGVLVSVEKEHYEDIKQHFISVGVPIALAERAASTSAMYSCLDIIGAVRKNNMKTTDVATAFYLVGQRLETDWLRHRIVNHVIENNWESLSRAILRDDLTWEQIELVVNVLKFGDSALSIAEQIDAWFVHNQAIVDRWQHMLADFRSNDNISFTMFFVAVRELLGVVQASRRVNYDRLIQSRASVKRVAQS